MYPSFYMHVNSTDFRLKSCTSITLAADIAICKRLYMQCTVVKEAARLTM
jgi:hypothetical protein